MDSPTKLQSKTEQNLNGFTQITDRFSYNRMIRLGGGSFGVVYKGYDHQAKRFIAVKQIPRSNLYGFPQGELKEIQVMKQLKHPNIMEFYGSHGDKFNPEGIFMFIELCDKGTLADLIDKKLSQSQTHVLFRQLVEGMEYMHSKKLFHRDLKPQNLLITSKFQLRIADFGIAREIKEGHKTFKKCTPIYSAPQVYVQQIYDKNSQGNKEQYNQSCDVFSAGYILYEMLTSQQLTKGIKTAEQLRRFLITAKNQNGFKFEGTSISPEWISLLKNMLSFNFKERPSFSIIKNKLKSILPKVNKVPQNRHETPGRIQQSATLLKKVKRLIEVISSRNNYLVNILKVFNKFQQQRSQLIPRVYKVMILYYSLARYCYQSQLGLTQIQNKEEFYIPDKSKPLSALEDIFTVEDKIKMNEFLKTTANRINEGKEQMKLFVSNQIVTKIFEILRYPEDNLERKFIKQFNNIEDEIEKFKINEFATDFSYIKGLKACVNNLYRTTAELQVLTDQDLKIYLVCLYTTNIDNYLNWENYEACNFPPKYEDIIRKSRGELQSQISVQKNKI